MRENSLYDRKSLRAIYGSKADFKEIAKDCVGFANAQGGVIDLGIEDNADIPDAAQRIPENLPTKLINKIAGLTVNVSATTEKITANNEGEFLRQFIQRNAHSLASTSDGKTKIVEYRIVPQLLRDSNFKGKTTLKRIEPYRLRELILEDLKLYGASSIKEINARIGEEIPRRTLSRAIKELIDSDCILSSGYGKTLRYELSRQFKSNKVKKVG